MQEQQTQRKDQAKIAIISSDEMGLSIFRNPLRPGEKNRGDDIWHRKGCVVMLELIPCFSWHSRKIIILTVNSRGCACEVKMYMFKKGQD